MRKFKILTYLFCRSIGLFKLAHFVTRKNLKILCYHGFEIDDETSFRPKLFIRQSDFERRIKTIHRHGYTVLKLGEAIEKLYSGTLPDNSAVITIDDGFYSVAKIAAPVLSRHQLPATVYATTYYVENNNPIFRLSIQYIFWKTTKNNIILLDTPWGKMEQCDLSINDAREQLAWKFIDHGEKQCSESQRIEVCKSLGRQLDVDYDNIIESGILRLMTLNELESLSSYNIDIELHTHRHTFPPDSYIDAKREIDDNRNALKDLAPKDFVHFCYPSGYWEEKQWEWLESFGVVSATTCLPGLNSQHTPRHALRRFLDGANIHQLEFEANLCGFADIIRDNVARLRSTLK